VELLCSFSCFLLTEAENIVLVVSSISDWHVSKASCETLKNLLLSFLSEEKLHVAADALIGTLIDTNQIAPFCGRINSVIHNLAFFKFTLLLEDSSWGVSIIDVGVEDVCLAHNTELVLTDPFPEPNWLCDLTLFELSFCVKVEDLFLQKFRFILG